MTEPARSGRGKCKKCKEPIAKGEVRMGKGYEKDDHVMWVRAVSGGGWFVLVLKLPQPLRLFSHENGIVAFQCRHTPRQAQTLGLVDVYLHGCQLGLLCLLAVCVQPGRALLLIR